MRTEQSSTIGRFVRFRRRRGQFFSPSNTLHDRGPAAVRTGAKLKPMHYGLFKRLVDRRNASRDGRSGCPEYTEHPEPTPYIKRLTAKFVEQAAVEREQLDREIAPCRQALAKLAVDIQAAQNASTIEQKRFDSGLLTTANKAHHDPEVQAWRQQRDHQMKQQLEATITSRNKQCLDRQNQLAAHTWARIETYWGRLIQVHPDGELMNKWINEWRPSQLTGPLQRLIELNELSRYDESSEAIDPSEID